MGYVERQLKLAITGTYILYVHVQKSYILYLCFQCNQIHKKLFMVSTGLAFIWPAKKINKESTKSSVDTVTSVMEHADSLFENGHYEECYNILKSCKVSFN